MDYSDIQPLLNAYYRKLAATDLRFKRYLHDRIDWSVRLVGIKGARGVGKTTMLLQHIKETFSNINDVIYVSLDNLWFENHELEELVEFLYTHGILHIYFDEVHRYRNWTTLLKHFYDNYPDLNIVYTGSAMLAIDNSTADLSRRQSLYTLNGLSFREYLEYENIATIPPAGLEHLLSDHAGYALNVSSKIKVLKHFDDYLRKGYYPYYKEAGEDYMMRIGEVVRLIIDNDIQAVENITYITAQKIKKLLMIIAGNVPLEPNINKLASQLESTRDQTLKTHSLTLGYDTDIKLPFLNNGSVGLWGSVNQTENDFTNGDGDLDEKALGVYFHGLTDENYRLILFGHYGWAENSLDTEGFFGAGNKKQNVRYDMDSQVYGAGLYFGFAYPDLSNGWFFEPFVSGYTYWIDPQKSNRFEGVFFENEKIHQSLTKIGVTGGKSLKAGVGSLALYAQAAWVHRFAQSHDLTGYENERAETFETEDLQESWGYLKFSGHWQLSPATSVAANVSVFTSKVVEPQYELGLKATYEF